MALAISPVGEVVPRNQGMMPQYLWMSRLKRMSIISLLSVPAHEIEDITDGIAGKLPMGHGTGAYSY